MSKNEKTNFNDKNKGKNQEPNKGFPNKTTSTPPVTGKPGVKPAPNAPRK